jgi:hypothetical protein
MKHAALLALMFTASASALSRVPGTNTAYSYSLDPITDVNTSAVSIDEQYDQYRDTVFTLRCDDRGQPSLWAMLRSKNDLVTEAQAAQGALPAVTIRLGEDPAVTLRERDLVSVVDYSDNLKTRNLGLYGPVVGQIVRGLQSGKRLAVRINRLTGGQPLTYLFPATGFNIAWSGVRACGGASGVSTARPSTPSPAQSSGVVPKFTQWYFTTCRDAQTNTVRAGLIAGRAHLCDLVIETIPNGSLPDSATFSYELEYRENGQAGKLKLSGTDGWQAEGNNVNFRREGQKLIFTLPLNVRIRSNRVYTSLNVIGALNYGGVVKKVFEPLPVRPGN